jgi:hypothetical protein
MILFEFTLVILTLLICSFGLISNILVIVVVKQNRKELKENHYKFTINAISNVFILLIQAISLISECQRFNRKSFTFFSFNILFDLINSFGVLVANLIVDILLAIRLKQVIDEKAKKTDNEEIKYINFIKILMYLITFLFNDFCSYFKKNRPRIELYQW